MKASKGSVTYLLGTEGGEGGGQRTKLNFSISDNEVRCIGFILDIDRFIEEFEQLLSVHQGGVDGSIDGSEHVQRFIKLYEVCDEKDEVAGGALSIRYSQGHDDRSDEKAESLMSSQSARVSSLMQDVRESSFAPN